MGAWFRTDDTQAVKKVSEDVFEVVEVVRVVPLNDVTKARFAISYQTIDIAEYTLGEILDVVSGYGYGSIEELRKLYGNDYKQIIAECIAETFWDILEPVFTDEVAALRYVEDSIVKGKLFTLGG